MWRESGVRRYVRTHTHIGPRVPSVPRNADASGSLAAYGWRWARWRR